MQNEKNGWKEEKKILKGRPQPSLSLPQAIRPFQRK